MSMSLGDGGGPGDLCRINDLDAVRRALDAADATGLLAGMADGLGTLLGP
ncbi:MAG TPA: hypothetical protein VIJ34_05905 [Acidimicrobiales bacterium]